VAPGTFAPPMSDRRTNLAWIDLEMTGLDPDQCFILEVATLVTTQELDLVAEGPTLVVHLDEEQLKTLSTWSRETFGASGLLDRVRASTISAFEAEERTLAFLMQHTEVRTSPLCGNSVHTDRQFLWRHMRRLHDHFHYRNVDVSSWKELLRRWYPERYAPPMKAGSHVALADVHESVAELRYYRDAFLPGRGEGGAAARA
jgi:oligoribonuclease